MTIKKEEIKAKRAKRPYEGTPAYKAGYKDAVEEFRTFYDAYNVMNNTIIAMQLIDAQFEEMLKKV